jgi:hypothetical protein
MMKEQRLYDEAKYLEHLRRLPRTWGKTQSQVQVLLEASELAGWVQTTQDEWL